MTTRRDCELASTSTDPLNRSATPWPTWPTPSCRWGSAISFVFTRTRRCDVAPKTPLYWADSGRPCGGEVGVEPLTPCCPRSTSCTWPGWPHRRRSGCPSSLHSTICVRCATNREPANGWRSCAGPSRGARRSRRRVRPPLTRSKRCCTCREVELSSWHPPCRRFRPLTTGLISW